MPLTKISDFSQRILPWVLMGYLVLIILVPKIPLFQTNSPVPIRVDDIFIIPVVLLTFLASFRNNNFVRLLKTPLTKYLIAWLVVLLLATLVGIKAGTVADPKVGLLFWLRYVQYSIVFYAGYLSIQKVHDLKQYFYLLIALIIPIGIYALLQRYGFVGGFGGAYYNYKWVGGADRSFATFAGPYELAAFMVFTMPILTGLGFYWKSLISRLSWGILYILSILTLSFTAARTPLASVFFGVSTFLIFIKGWRGRLFIVVLAIAVVVIPFFASDTLVARSKSFLATANSYLASLNPSPPATQPTPGQPTGSASTNKTNSPSTSSSPPPKSLGLTSILSEILSKESNSITNSTSAGSGTVASSAPGVSNPSVIVEPSLKWRFDNLWPQAIARFRADPILGGGLYSSGISVDSTYLTILGETGLIGSIVFLTLILKIVQTIWMAIRMSEGLERLLLIGLMGGLIGLLINAVFIDVFRASKIAYMFWIMIGVTAGYLATRRSGA